MRRVISVFCLLIITATLYSQGLLTSGTHLNSSTVPGRLPDNMRLNLEVGSNFSSYSSGMSSFGSYLAPDLQFNVNPDFTIIAGGKFAVNQYNTPSLSILHQDSPVQAHRPSDYSAYLSGVYRISENLLMTGTLYRDEGTAPGIMMGRGNANTSINPALYNYSNQGMSMGIQYRVSETIQFGARVGVNRSDNPGYYSPFHSPYRAGRSDRGFFPYW